MNKPNLFLIKDRRENLAGQLAMQFLKDPEVKKQSRRYKEAIKPFIHLSSAHARNWYNTIYMTPVGKHTLGRYVAYSDSIDDFSQYITQNTLLYSENCGIDYLPLKLLEGKKM